MHAPAGESDIPATFLARLTFEEFDDFLARSVGRYEMRVEEAVPVAR